MLILLDQDTLQTVKFNARKINNAMVVGTATTVFTDEQENTTTTDTVALVTDRYYTKFSQAIPELEEDRHYMLTVTASSTEIFKGKVFVTNQTVSSYSINNTEYTERDVGDEYTFF